MSAAITNRVTHLRLNSVVATRQESEPAKEHGLSEHPFVAASVGNTLRPSEFDDFVGQENLKHRLSIIALAARSRKEILPHILLGGPPGLGKTTMANILATMMGVRFTQSAGMALTKVDDLSRVVTDIKGGVFFVDEIHAIPKRVSEVLYTAMEDFAIDTLLDFEDGPELRRVTIPPFTFVGATTHMGLLTAPLRDRFGFLGHLQYYTVEDLALIIKKSAHVLRLHVSDEAALIIGGRSRGTPRVANKLLLRARDFATVYGDGRVDERAAKEALEIFGVDEIGLNEMGRSILRTIIDRFQGGPVGLTTLAAALGIAEETLEDAFEPYLLQRRLIDRTPRGRIATPLAYSHIERHSDF